MYLTFYHALETIISRGIKTPEIFPDGARDGTSDMNDSTNIEPDISSVTLISDLATPLPSGLNNALNEARSFISFYDWVSSIRTEFLGAEVDGILYAFLFEIVPARSDVDQWIWVIVGDIPPAYITCEDAQNPYEAVDAYVGAMEEWVNAAQDGKSVANLIPVNVPASPANAVMLNRRLKFIDERILPTLTR